MQSLLRESDDEERFVSNNLFDAFVGPELFPAWEYRVKVLQLSQSAPNNNIKDRRRRFFVQSLF